MQISAVQVNLALRAVKESKQAAEQEAQKPADAADSGPLSRADTFERSQPVAAPLLSPAVVKLAAADVESADEPAQSSPTPAQGPATPGAISTNPNPVEQSTQPVQPRTYSAVDREALLASWGAQAGEQRFASQYDLDGDGVIGSSDLAQLLGAFQADPNAAPTPAQTSDPASDNQPSISPELKGLYAAWNKQVGENGYDNTFDLDGDGVVNSSDLALFLGSQNSAPAQSPLTPPPPADTTQTEPSPAPTSAPIGDQIKNLYAAWGSRNGDEAFNAAFDFDGDGVITSTDLAQLLGQANQKA